MNTSCENPRKMLRREPLAATALLYKTRCHIANGLRVMRSQSLFKLLFIAGFALCFEIGLWILFNESFSFLASFGDAGMLLIGKLFALFFTGMGVMLGISSIVTSYSTFFGAEDIPFLMVRPFSISQIVIYKFIESVGFSSWAFFFVIIPFVGSYAWHQKLSPVFAIWTMLFSLPFLFLLSSIGTLLVLVIVRWMPRRRILKQIGIPLVIVAVIIAWHLTSDNIQPLLEKQLNVTQLVPGLKLASHPLNPGAWVSDGIMAFSQGDWKDGLIFLAALLSSAGVAVSLIEMLGASTFYDAWQKTIAGGHKKRKAVLLSSLDGLENILPHDVSAIMLKDIRTFFRDASQWSQALVFFGLLAFYFANLRTLNYDALPDDWRSVISFLNVFAVAAVMSSLGSRFIYPQLSLEGHGFWLLGLSPVTKYRILSAKFLLAIISMTTIGITLIWLSGSMLESPPAIKLASIAIIASIAITICGVSTGLGALFLDLDQRNPAAIVSGFGGTLNLVVCLGFMLLSIMPFGILFYLDSTEKIMPAQFQSSIRLAGFWLAGLTLLTTGIPLYLGLRAMQNRDY